MTTTEPAPSDSSPAAAKPSPPAEADEPRTNVFGLVAVVAFFGWVYLSWGWSGLLVVGSLFVMIFMHELGHYATAKWSGMKATEFFLGFGPRLWSFRRGETEYGLKALPLGAYVRIIGMNNLEEVDPADEHRTFRQQTYPKRLLVAVAGSAMHFVMAILLIYALLVGWGIRSDDTQWAVAGIAEDSTAAVMGLEEGDRVVSVDGVAVTTFDEMRQEIERRPGQPVELRVLRDGEVFSVTGTLGDADGAGRLGVLFRPSDLPLDRLDPLTAAPRAVTEFGSITKDATVAIARFFTPSGLSEFFGNLFDREEAATGGVDAGAGGGAGAAEGSGNGGENRVLSIFGAARIGTQLTDDGLAGLFLFMVMINVFVGVFNLLPMLPLDGGHVLVATYERLRSTSERRYHADVAKLLPLTYAVLAVLLSIGLVALWLDITDPVTL